MASEPAVLTWDEETVHVWLSSIGFAQYYENIVEHGISGDVLIQLDFDSLRDVGITSAGHRLDILRAIYRLKVENKIPIESDHYVPLSEADEDVFTDSNTPFGRIMQMITNQNERIRILEQENQRLQQGLMTLEEYVVSSRPSGGGLHKQPSFKWATYGKSVKSPTKAMPDEHTGLSLQPHESPRASPQALEHELATPASSLSLLRPPKAIDGDEITAPRTSSLPPYTSDPPPAFEKVAQPARSQITTNGDVKETKRSGGEDRADNVFQSFKVSLDDPCSKVLPAALKKYRITDDWRLYALFICYGTTERCLSLDEKPLLLFKKLKDAGKNPVFMLRHVRDIRAPITVAQGKQAEKKAKNGDSPVADAGQPMKKSDKVANSPYSRDTRLHQTPASIMQSLHNPASRPNGMSDVSNSGQDGDRSRLPSEDTTNGVDTAIRSQGPGHTDAVILWNGISYAVAIYPYGAGYEDEFDVTVGAMFVVLRRSKGWWQVQRDPSGSGTVDDSAKKAWVPAGCLLETSVPPATAVAEASILASAQPNSPAALDVKSLSSPGVGTFPMSDAPILPSSIVSTSYPGVALMDWLPQGDHELDLVKDDVLRVFKRYNHWSYVVKEGGRRGWVPSWLIGKAASGSTIPPTPNTAPQAYESNGDDSHMASRSLGVDLSQANIIGFGQAPQPSPMSPAFASLVR